MTLINPAAARGRSSYRCIGDRTGSPGPYARWIGSGVDYRSCSACGWIVHRGWVNDYQTLFEFAPVTTGTDSNLVWLGVAYNDATNVTWYVAGQSSQIISGFEMGVPFFFAFSCSSADAIAYMRKGSDANFYAAISAGGPPSSGITSAQMCVGDSIYAEPMDGSFWNVKVWDAPLTASELLQESYSVLPVRQANLHAWFPFEGSFNETFHDRSGNNRHLQLTTPTAAFVGQYFLPAKQFARPAPRRPFGAVSGATTLNSPIATHTYTGQVPKVNVKVAPGVATHTYTAQVPKVSPKVAPGAATHSYTGRTPALPAKVVSTVATHAYTALAPQAKTKVAPGATTHTYSALAPQAKSQVAAPVATHTYLARLPASIGGAVSVAAVVGTHSYLALPPQIIISGVTPVPPPVGAASLAGAWFHPGEKTRKQLERERQALKKKARKALEELPAEAEALLASTLAGEVEREVAFKAWTGYLEAVYSDVALTRARTDRARAARETERRRMFHVELERKRIELNEAVLLLLLSL